MFQVKDLKRQLKLERKRSEQLQQRLQEALSESRAKQSKFRNVPVSVWADVHRGTEYSLESLDLPGTSE